MIKGFLVVGHPASLSCEFQKEFPLIMAVAIIKDKDRGESWGQKATDQS